MNPAIEEQMRAADSAMVANGEEQPGDGRAATSAANGGKGGRPPVDWGAVAEEYQVRFGTAVRWHKGEFYEYDPERGAYRRTTEREQGARGGAFLREPVAPVK